MIINVNIFFRAVCKRYSYYEINLRENLSVSYISEICKQCTIRRSVANITKSTIFAFFIFDVRLRLLLV